MWKITALLAVISVVVGIDAEDYCELCKDHTMCKYKGPSSKCQVLLRLGVTVIERQEIVDISNELRAKIASGQQDGQPTASNMRQMTWDDELAKVAQRWAEQCTFSFDSCRTVQRFGVGQNVYLGSSIVPGTPSNWRAALESWYDEVINFDPSNISPFKFNSTTGYYTQLLWAESYKVGCGFAQYKNDIYFESLYICNIGPGGNVIGGDMYKEGESCSDCPEGSGCQDNLCV